MFFLRISFQYTQQPTFGFIYEYLFTFSFVFIAFVTVLAAVFFIGETRKRTRSRNYSEPIND